MSQEARARVTMPMYTSAMLLSPPWGAQYSARHPASDSTARMSGPMFSGALSMYIAVGIMRYFMPLVSKNLATALGASAARFMSTTPDVRLRRVTKSCAWW